ncbi:MAG: hypothetical protein IKV13_05640, partial [Akkermansia sp.]|nr:hypothetical protein [Akkermansia sp.]
ISSGAAGYRPCRRHGYRSQWSREYDLPNHWEKAAQGYHGNEIRLTPDEIHAKRGRYRSVPLRRYLLPQQTVEGMDIIYRPLAQVIERISAAQR